MLRFPKMVPSRVVSTHLNHEEASAILQKARIRHLLGFRAAANLWAFFEPDPRVQILVERKDLQKVCAVLKEHTGSPKSDIWAVELFADDLDELGSDVRNGIPVTSRLQTWIDLQHFPMAGAHATFFRFVLKDEYPEIGGGTYERHRRA